MYFTMNCCCIKSHSTTFYVFQAAATGETILDDELSSLASRNVSRFQRLNQRLQGGTMPRTSRLQHAGGLIGLVN